ncbi:MAG: type III polyketide synthase [Isosphaeraceae bacterium]|nr:type III polyketide synthase [Isosphaeraceae bacterium]
MASEFVIAGLGTELPRHRISQSDSAALAGSLSSATSEQQRKLAALYRSTGVQTRGSVLLESRIDGPAVPQSFYPPQRSPEDRGPSTAERMQRYEDEARVMAFEACRSALSASGCDPLRITHLVTVSCSGFSAPGVDIELMNRLALSANVMRTHVGFMGCHGAINGLRVAQAHAAADPGAVVLLCAVELCSLHQQYGWHSERLVANALFSDGAAAVVGHSRTANAETRPRLIATGAGIVPDTTDLMSWRIGDHGFEMTLSPRVPDAIRRSLRPWLSAWLESHGLTIDSVGSWAIHPGGPRILTAVAEAAGFDEAHLRVSRSVLAECGNMSSPTILFILDRLWREQAPGPCVVLAFGPGLAIEAALFA